MILYGISLILTVIDIFAFFGAGGYMFYLWQINDLSEKGMYILIAIMVVCAILYPLINIMRQKSRMHSKYDKYGRLKQTSQYEKMSVKEQKELDKQRVLELEKMLPSTFVREITKRGTKTPEADMDALIGMDSIKMKVEEMEARMEKERKDKKKETALSRHMVFFGPPGTGKTTVVSVMTSYLFKYGYIKDNRFLQINGTFFSGIDAPKKMEAIVQKSFGGVLFIDEAYSILQGPYGDETVSTLLTQMEDNRDKFVLIMAGYEDEMKDLLRSNPGFMSRVSEFLYFENYSVDELAQIFKGMAKKEGYSVDREGIAEFKNVIAIAMREYSFGNARTCRTILDKSISRHCLNIKRSRKKDNYVLTGEDIAYEKNPLA